MNTHLWLSRLIAGLISIIQASTLRERYYIQQERITILATAIDDIGRINSASHSPNKLISNIVINTRNKV